MRLLLADDLSLYPDVDAPGPLPPVLLPDSTELPYHDGRHVGRVLTVAADGTLTWVFTPALPVSNGRDAGSVLYIGQDGRPYWAPLDATTADEVLETDDDGVAQVVIGPDLGTLPGAVDGSIWLVSLNTSTVVAPPTPPAAAPVLTVT